MASPGLTNIWSWYHGTASDSKRFAARPLQEVAMMRASAWFRVQPGWIQSLRDPAYMRRAEHIFRHEFRLSVKQARFVVNELQQYYGPVEATNCEVVRQMPLLDGVWFSDVAIDAECRDRLSGVFDKLAAQKRLHVSPKHRLEYDLVFPTRHALVRGVSKQQPTEFAKEDAIRHMGNTCAVPVSIPPKQYEHDPEPLLHAWLPCEARVDATGSSAQIASYIPGVHPEQHADVYDVLSEALSAFLPLWQRVIVDLMQPDVHRLTCIVPVAYAELLTDADFPGRIRKRLERQRVGAALKAHTQPQPEEVEDNEQLQSDDEYYTPEENDLPVSLIEKKAYVRSDDRESSAFHKLPDPANDAYQNMAQKAAVHTDSSAAEQLFSWKGRRLQVVVRMAEVELSADTCPVFPGGAWHVEGMEHERIVASGIYYLEHDNLTTCSIEFRHSFDEPPGIYDDEFACEQFWGARTFQEFGFVRKMGEVPIRAGRAVAFPNLWQHRVTEFGLQQPEGRGRRRVLVFFLVDPLRPVVSSATVIPQERAWARAAFYEHLRAATSWCEDLIGIVWSYVADEYGWDDLIASHFETAMQSERQSEARYLAQRVGRRVQTTC